MAGFIFHILKRTGQPPSIEFLQTRDLEIGVDLLVGFNQVSSCAWPEESVLRRSFQCV